MYTYIDCVIILVIYYITKTEHLYPLKHSLETALSPSLSSVYSYFTQHRSIRLVSHETHRLMYL